jgi:valyl-tRNA synthetase
MKLDEIYNPLEVESRWYDFWVSGGFFRADVASEKPPYTIMIPPPNVTGHLHIGHALFVTLQDLLIRWKRMDGFEALWLPGTDHAGIATQVMVERQLAEEGTDRHALGRSAFTERVWEWKREKGGRILEQMKRMGASCDWSRERFTMDEGLSEAVREAFVQLYEEGLIYRAERMVDWDPGTMTVLSDLEVDREEEMGSFWYLRYPLTDGSGSIVVGTTRPETMLGDTAVAVHPDDARYADMVGKMVTLPLVGRQIPIIADAILPDPEKGTGAVKVTPAHDPNDFDCGERHGLERIQVIGFDASMMDTVPDGYRSLDRYAARKKVIANFDELGLLVDVEDRSYTPGRSSRSGQVVEPLPLTQWFVDTRPLAKSAIDAVESGRTTITPSLWKKTFDHFMYNIKPWCISRQLWWGHQIPAWYCDHCGHITVGRQDPTQCGECKSADLRQDDDVLDTWFSSGIWPFSTLGWPQKTADLERFYPTQVMETGSDILFFWVARMLMMGTHLMKETPFKDVFLHAMVRDSVGRKMSKTSGNVIDPLHMIHGIRAEDLNGIEHAELLRQYPDGIGPQGADALRLTLTIYAAQGRDIKLDIKRIEGYRAFLNKLWNASKFVVMNTEDVRFDVDEDGSIVLPVDDMSVVDKWIVSRLQEVIESSTKALDDFRFNDYAQGLYHFVWHEFCDWYIEYTKHTLYDESPEGQPARRAAQTTLVAVLETALRLMHPVTPFITEDIWQSLPVSHSCDSLMVAPWPSHTSSLFFEESRDDVMKIEAFITAVRTVRGENRIKPSKEVPLAYWRSADEGVADAIERGHEYIERLAKIGRLQRLAGSESPGHEGVAVVMAAEIEISIPMAGLIDVAEEIARIHKSLEKVDKEISIVERKLSNQKFVDNAPPAVVDQQRARLERYRGEKNVMMDNLGAMQKMESGG